MMRFFPKIDGQIWILSYWVFPLISAAMWLATILALFIHWETVGHPRYSSMEPGQTIAYISDVGAQSLKPLFIVGCSITTIFLDLAFGSERFLRHRGVLARNVGRGEKILSALSIVAALVGTVGLILLSVFDTLRYPRAHNVFLVLFIAGYIVSAVFICSEYQRLGIHYRNHRVLRVSFWIKLAFILLEVALAVAFGVLGRYHHRNAAAVVEWIIALIFTFYLLSFVIDLLPSVRTSRHTPQGLQAVAGMEEKGMTGGPPVSATDSGEPLTTDSAGPATVPRPQPVAGRNF